MSSEKAPVRDMAFCVWEWEERGGRQEHGRRRQVRSLRRAFVECYICVCAGYMHGHGMRVEIPSHAKMVFLRGVAKGKQ